MMEAAQLGDGSEIWQKGFDAAIGFHCDREHPIQRNLVRLGCSKYNKLKKG